jgi:dipeptidyl aminopeptidase/acylaminoacyl peptidase
LTFDEAEYAPPAWGQGEHSLAWSSDSQSLVAIRSHNGNEEAVRLSLTTQQALDPVHLPGVTYWAQVVSSPTDRVIAAITSGDQEPSRITIVDQENRARVVRFTGTNEVAKKYLANAEAVTWSSQATLVHGLFYRPMNPDYTSLGLPPLVVLVHGGPTGHEARSYSAQTQYFTTRGFAVLRLNYRGSTGYGRAYRKALEHNWGIFDVEDAVSGAQFCVDQGWVNPRQLVIMGGSAGGYTVLKTLVDHPGFFKAGVSLFGVSNLFTLAAETHKFESRYLDSMLGPLPAARDVYYDRSPISHATKIQDALAVFQGEEDVVVPRNQADTLVDVLKSRGVPHFYEVYPGEGHGWRRAETIEKFYQSLHRFLIQYVIYG